MPRLFNPKDMSAPLAAYTHGVEVQPTERMIFFSGQVGIDKSGNLPSDFESQFRNVFDNIRAILLDADMDFENLIKLTTYMVGRDNLDEMRKLRLDLMEGHKPAHTLLVISGLASPDFFLEVEGFAAQGPAALI